jgi:two-component system CheB/CheR fusion protein
VKESGGIILVQDPAEAEHPSMPSAAISTEVVDFILPLKQLAERLTDLIRSKDRVAEVQRTADEEENLRRILAHLWVRTGHDFSHYKRSTVMRRLLRRMQVTRKDQFEDYFSYLRDHVEEAQALLADLLISVTAFFRDPKSFESLAVNVIPHLFRREDHNPVRVWVAGCATGEEA